MKTAYIEKDEVFHICCLLAKCCAVSLGRGEDKKYIEKLATFLHNEQLAHIARSN